MDKFHQMFPSADGQVVEHCTSMEAVGFYLRQESDYLREWGGLTPSLIMAEHNISQVLLYQVFR